MLAASCNRALAGTSPSWPPTSLSIQKVSPPRPHQEPLPRKQEAPHLPLTPPAEQHPDSYQQYGGPHHHYNYSPQPDSTRSLSPPSSPSQDQATAASQNYPSPWWNYPAPALHQWTGNTISSL